MSNDRYMNNPNLPKAGTLKNWTPERIQEFQKCMVDPVYFAEKYFRIVHPDHGLIPFTLHDFQKEAIQEFQGTRKMVINASRQVGKCVDKNTRVMIRNKTSMETKACTIIEFIRCMMDKIYPNISCLPDDRIIEEFIEAFSNDTPDEKLIATAVIHNYEIQTDNGFADISHLHCTRKYKTWRLKTSSGLFLNCADEHLVFLSGMRQVRVDELVPGARIFTRFGLESVISVEELQEDPVHMFDFTVKTADHRYFTNDILSHNTTIATAIILHFVLFNENRPLVGLLANKADTAREILSRIQLAYEYLPDWLKGGVVEWNKGSVTFENGAKIIASASSSSSIRGKSCLSGETFVCIEDDDGHVWYKKMNEVNVIKEITQYEYVIYKTVNKLNDKEYIGYHKTERSQYINSSESGSLFYDGYLGSGKILKDAIAKYGPENFSQSIIKVFDNSDDALKFERELVNEEYVSRDDTYNISLGGGICALPGELNPFFGKRHSDEVIIEITQKREETRKELGGFDTCAKCVDTRDGKQYKSFVHLIEENESIHDKFDVYDLVRSGDVKVFNYDIEQSCIRKSIERELLNSDEHKEFIAEMRKSHILDVIASGKTHNPTSNKLRREALTRWEKAHPEEFANKMLKINTNPEKIRKMAEKQNGTCWIYNPVTDIQTRFKGVDIPDGFIKGTRKGYNK